MQSRESDIRRSLGADLLKNVLNAERVRQAEGPQSVCVKRCGPSEDGLASAFFGILAFALEV
jgi:hypothetical protein